MREVTPQALQSFAFPRYRSAILMLFPAIGFMAIALILFLLTILGLSDSPLKIERPYLIPWVLATGVVIAAPSIYLKYRGEFSFANPLVLAALIYFLPVFFIGGWSLVFGLSHYHYLAYVQDPETNFPLAFLYIILGYSGLCVGYFIPQARSLGKKVSIYLPEWNLPPSELALTCMLFLAVGFCLNIVALEAGQIGYQSAGPVDPTGSIAYFLTIVLPATSFLLWTAFFRLERWGVYHILIAVAQAVTAAFMLVVLGGKGSLLLAATLSIGAFVLVKRDVKARHWMVFSVVLSVCLVLGTIYGNTFRGLKGGTDRVSTEEYVALAGESMTQIGESGLYDQLTNSFLQLANRLETVSALAVVVSNREALMPYEESYGLDNNIWTYTWTALIPRFIWTDKPVISDGYSYNELYFDRGGSGLSITVMGDLLRNFGPLGVPLGMILLGFMIRAFYAALVEGFPFSAWKCTVFFLVLLKLNYDGFYGDLLPRAIRVIAVIVLLVILLRIVIQAIQKTRS